MSNRDKEEIVVFASQQYGVYWSGLGAYATWLIDTLAVNRKVAVITPQSGTGEKASDNISVINLKPGRFDPTHGHWFSLSLGYYKIIRKLSRKSNIRYIHFTDARESLFSILFLPEKLRRRMVGTQHDFYFAAFRCNPFFYRKRYLDGFKRWLYYFFVNRMEKLALRRLPLLISNTDYVKDIVSRAYGLDEKKIETVYIGLPRHWLEKAENYPEKKRDKEKLLFVGGNFQRKGLLNLARMIKLIAADFPGLKVVVIGRDPNQGRIEKYLEKRGVRDHFDFRGFVTPDELAEYYAAGAALFMPAQIEAYGLVFLEALAFGCPVYGTSKGGTEELFRLCGSGKTIDPDDTEKGAEIIKNLFLSEKYDTSRPELPGIEKTIERTLSIINSRLDNQKTG